jgi:hypothetical protein
MNLLRTENKGGRRGREGERERGREGERERGREQGVQDKGRFGRDEGGGRR